VEADSRAPAAKFGSILPDTRPSGAALFLFAVQSTFVLEHLTMFRKPLLIAAAFTIATIGGNRVFAQTSPARTSPEPQFGDQGLKGNTIQSGEAAAAPNKIITPLPLSAKERDSAMAAIDQHIGEEVSRLKEKLKSVLPDELAILAKTAGWKPEKQNALLVALRSGDPAAVFEAWSQGNPQDAAGAEIVARQTDVKRVLGRLEQNVKNKAPISQDLKDLETALGKITTSTPDIADANAALAATKTWAEVRKLVESAQPESGPVAKLPPGKVSLVYDPSLPLGRAIVLGNSAVMIGDEGHGPVTIKTGIAAEALGLPIVTGTPVPDAEGQEIDAGIFLVNPNENRATVNYNINGNHFIMEPGMKQRLPGAGPWIIEYDRGAKGEVNAYTLAAGTYYFTATDKGWQLYKQRFDVVLDNSQNPQEFNFLFEGKNVTVPANGTRAISSMYPLVVRYDRGNGTDLAAKAMRFSGTVQVGVNPTDNLWDLFPTNKNQREVTTLKLFQ
jgi:hypothetical protein